MEVAAVVPGGGRRRRASWTGRWPRIAACGRRPERDGAGRRRSTMPQRRAVRPARSPCARVPVLVRQEVVGRGASSGRAYVMGAGRFVLGDAFDDVSRGRRASWPPTARVLAAGARGGLRRQDGAICGQAPALLGIRVPSTTRSARRPPRPSATSRTRASTVNVISGDDPRTVAGIAAQVGVRRRGRVRGRDDARDAASRWPTPCDRYQRVRPREARAEEAVRHGAAGTGPRGGHDRRRRERHAGAQAGRLLGGHGRRLGRGAQRGPARARGQRLRQPCRRWWRKGGAPSTTCSARRRCSW